MPTLDDSLQGMYRTSFGGCDITAVFGTKIIGTLQAISYSITREKGPLYTMRGSADPLAFARGKRAIAGTLIFVVLYHSPLLKHFQSGDMPASVGASTRFYASKHDIPHSYVDDKLFAVSGSPFNTIDTLLSDGPGSERIETNPWYTDQIPPFNINISAANEVGNVMKRTFIGVEIMNEGGGISIDDLVMEEQYTYVCRTLTQWTQVLNPNRGGSTQAGTDQL